MLHAIQDERFSHLGTPSPDCIFTEEGYYVWCGSLFRHGDTYYLAYARWKKEHGFNGWVTHSEICLAAGASPFGKFRFVRVLHDRRTRAASKQSAAPLWDRDCAHNPTVFCHDGKYYLYYMGNYGDGTFWDHRNHQRIGVCWTDDPLGTWHFSDTPLLDVTPGSIDSLMVSNPTVTDMVDGRFLLLYKAVTDHEPLPAGGPVLCGAAIGDTPLGPFHKTGVPLFGSEKHSWSVEDPFVWREGNTYYALMKDFHGDHTGTGQPSTALFVSGNGTDWHVAKHPLAFGLEVGGKRYHRLERPQLYLENGQAVCLVCAAAEDERCETVYSLRLPLPSKKR